MLLLDLLSAAPSFGVAAPESAGLDAEVALRLSFNGNSVPAPACGATRCVGSLRLITGAAFCSENADAGWDIASTGVSLCSIGWAASIVSYSTPFGGGSTENVIEPSDSTHLYKDCASTIGVMQSSAVKVSGRIMRNLSVKEALMATMQSRCR